ncbi:lipopolysaccharide biosynthesis protein [Streptomyces ochraceiscleroticus]|uniref:Lipopolysaccharide biosynthesis protein n=1 Tax=Streptomyces ochraceiscleroticus TaxID=47761 RepID=A0ABW1MQA7_9ACTN|nr:polysaccharide biosynthesis C-terminal domain-containing protein [Streptomyces ochraceiscleroticus]
MSDTTTRTEERPQDQAPDGRKLRFPGRGGGTPLFRNAYALMLNTGISGLLGLGFWLVAARYYTESAVGQGSAAIAAMKLLAGLTAVTLTGALARFIPVAGRATGRLVFRTYAGSSLVVAVAAGVFLLTLDLWGPSYRFLHGPLNGLGFIVAVVAWSVLTLQDGVLTGLRSALWVPVGNLVFSAVKLALLVAIAAAAPTAGVFVSWVAAIAVSVIPLGCLVFRRLVPRHIAATARTVRPPSLREMGRFLAGDYTGSLFSLAVVYLVPVLVASQVSAADNAYFYITSTIGGTVNLLAINMGASLTVEGSHDPARLAENTRAALRRMARIMLPVCLFLFVCAPYILGVFGKGYADAATPLLRWFAVGAALRVVMETYFAVLRAQSRTSGLAYLQGLLCLLVLGLTLLLLPRMGLAGAGVAEVCSLTVIASIAMVKLYGVVRGRPVAPLAKAPADGVAPDGDLADLAMHGDLGDAVRTPTWAQRALLDVDTMPLGVHVDFDHMERRPDVRPPLTEEPVRDAYREAAGAGAAGTGAAPPSGKPSWAKEAAQEAGDPGEAHTLPLPVVAPPSASEAHTVRLPKVTPAAPAPAAAAPAAPAAAGGTAGTSGAAPAARGGVAARLAARPDMGVWALLALALALFWLPLHGMGDADLDRMGGLGLISVLPVATLIGAALLAVAFAAALWLSRPRRVLLAATLLLTVVALHALPAVLEAEPRFATAWQHLGFLDYIGRTGTAVPDLDARWSWPGFFAGAQFLAEACGVTDFDALLRWWPLTIQLLYLPPVFLLLRSVRADWRAKWSAAWLFALCGWVGQDYFSPQGFTYLLYLVFVAVLLVWFRDPRVLRGRLRPGEAEVRPAGRRQRAVLLGVLIALFTVSVAGHQLTPFVMLGVLIFLVWVRRSTLRGLPLLLGVLVVFWIGFLAEPYWSGHFDELFGGIGGIGSNVTSSVAGRIEGGSSTHKLVLYTRVLLAGSVLALACWGVLRRRMAGFAERSLLVLAFVPFLAFGMQSYGGEMALRVFMFALPGACVLGALALFPRPAADRPAVDLPTTDLPTTDRPAAGRRGLGPLAALLAGLVLVFGFLVARWGNEPFERTRSGEVAAMEYVYAHDEPTVRLLWMTDDPVDNVTPDMPWGAKDMERVQYEPTLAPRDPVLVGPLVKALKDAGPQSYLIVNTGQSEALRLDGGYPESWERQLRANLDSRPELRRVVVNADAVLYELKDPPAGPVPQPAPGPAGPKVTWTPWSVAGGLAVVALLLLLGTREIVRVALPPSVGKQRWVQGSFWFSLPLLVVFLAALVQRFVTLS